jgi:hypothetical protein
VQHLHHQCQTNHRVLDRRQALSKVPDQQALRKDRLLVDPPLERGRLLEQDPPLRQMDQTQVRRQPRRRTGQLPEQCQLVSDQQVQNPQALGRRHQRDRRQALRQPEDRWRVEPGRLPERRMGLPLQEVPDLVWVLRLLVLFQQARRHRKDWSHRPFLQEVGLLACRRDRWLLQRLHRSLGSLLRRLRRRLESRLDPMPTELVRLSPLAQ